MKRIFVQFCVLGLISAFVLACASAAPVQPTDPVKMLVQTMHAFESRTPYPTATAYPSATPYPSQTPYPTFPPEQEDQSSAEPFPPIALFTPPPREQGILMLPGVWSKDLSQYVRCGDLFEMRNGYKTPYFGYAVGNEVSKSQFLIVNVLIRNISDETIPLIFHKQFKMIAIVDGYPQVYESYGPAGISASSRWGVHFISSQGIPPGVEMETYLAFDVNYKGTGWTLAFDADPGSGFDCQMAMKINTPEVPFRYMETLESAGRL